MGEVKAMEAQLDEDIKRIAAEIPAQPAPYLPPRPQPDLTAMPVYCGFMPSVSIKKEQDWRSEEAISSVSLVFRDVDGDLVRISCWGDGTLTALVSHDYVDRAAGRWLSYNRETGGFQTEYGCGTVSTQDRFKVGKWLDQVLLWTQSWQGQ